LKEFHQMTVGPASCTRCCNPIDFFKLKDDLWSHAGFQTQDLVCVDCVELAFGRKMTLADLDPLPWWGTVRLDYYQGILDGVGNRSSANPDAGTIYHVGITLGDRLARNSTQSEIATFLMHASRDLKRSNPQSRE
jgi:hypothetical protein